MFNLATPEQKAAINILKHHPEMPLFVAALKSEQKIIDKALRTAPIDNVKNLQGKAIVLQDLSNFLTS